jgi:hypothetical protein
MDSQAACRTYNILMGEGRKVLAAILLEKDWRDACRTSSHTIEFGCIIDCLRPRERFMVCNAW